MCLLCYPTRKAFRFRPRLYTEPERSFFMGSAPFQKLLLMPKLEEEYRFSQRKNNRFARTGIFMRIPEELNAIFFCGA